MQFKVPEQQVIEREVWQFAKADWDRLRDTLSEQDWSYIETEDTNAAAARLTNEILGIAQERIPKRTLRDKKSTHPWLTDRVIELVQAKQEAVGTDAE